MQHAEWRFANQRTIDLHEGDITRFAAEAIVNAANAALAGGGGVDGAIHRAAGPAMRAELDAIRAAQGGCSTGSAVVTGAGDLAPAVRFIFHAVGPVFRDGFHGEPGLLAACYRTCCRLADERGLHSLAFPSISTGAYRYPLPDAAQIALSTVGDYLLDAAQSLNRVAFVLYGRAAFDQYREALGTLTASRYNGR